MSHPRVLKLQEKLVLVVHRSKKKCGFLEILSLFFSSNGKNKQIRILKTSNIFSAVILTNALVKFQSIKSLETDIPVHFESDN